MKQLLVVIILPLPSSLLHSSCIYPLHSISYCSPLRMLAWEACVPPPLPTQFYEPIKRLKSRCLPVSKPSRHSMRSNATWSLDRNVSSSTGLSTLHARSATAAALAALPPPAPAASAASSSLSIPASSACIAYNHLNIKIFNSSQVEMADIDLPISCAVVDEGATLGCCSF